MEVTAAGLCSRRAARNKANDGSADALVGRGTDGGVRRPDASAGRASNIEDGRSARGLLRVRVVPTQLHEVLVEMFHARPELARELLAACAGIELAEGPCETASIDLSQAVPSEYRADAVTVIRGAGGEPRVAVVIEIQLAVDRAKAWSWPVYVCALRARLRCPVVLFVLTRDPVAAWARQPIETGHPSFALAPIVVGLSEVPRITEPAVAAQAPELAVLSVFGHPEVSVAYAASVGLAGLPDLSDEARQLYLDLILTALPRHARGVLEAMMLKGYEYQSDFARRYVASGKEEALDDMRREALRIARERLGTLTLQQQDAISELRDVRTVAELIAGVAAAKDTRELDVLLARLTHG
jgi:hypothetical protein